ncbi:piggyBac transposable element-derived protein 4-like [Leptopilina heterotoma]|uniref:piggyBac transposable element-derived protein 4-like n=1 Tax=Leptopilina heterotoma TaxID=63436 RepID=UPI001CA7F1F7|nr:piggyBac transposable element-derived protein 4-like [Leptopilina heterotoma]
MSRHYLIRNAISLQNQLLEGEEIVADDLPSDEEEDHAELMSDSDSEEDFEDDLNDLSIETDFIEKNDCIDTMPNIVCGENGHQWFTKEWKRLPNDNQIEDEAYPGPRGEAKNIKSPLEAWSLLFTDKLLEKIVKYTNEYIRQWRNETKTCDVFSPTYYDLILPEFKALLALFYFSGLQKAVNTNLEDLWSLDFGSTLYRSTMPLNRFKFLVQMIHFDDKSTRQTRRETDKFAPMREIWEDFISKCTQYYSPTLYCTIDDHVLSFQGPCPFKVYNCAKPDKYGMKIIMLNDSNTFYMYSAEPYVGTTEKESTESLPSYYIRKLSETIQGSWRNITCDNWFTSTEIFDKMLQNSITMVGSIRKTKGQIPQSLKSDAPLYSSKFLFDETKTLVKYVPREDKFLLTMSTLHSLVEIEMDTEKPTIISFYDSTKGATEYFNKLCDEYTVARKTFRWPLRFWYGMMDQAVINALILHNFNYENPNLTRREFLKKLVKELVEPQLRLRLSFPNLRQELRMSIQSILQVNATPPPPPKSPTKVRKATRCSLCPRAADRKVKTVCKNCQRAVCEDHRIILCSVCSITE